MNSITQMTSTPWTIDSPFGIAIQATLEDFAFEEPFPIVSEAEFSSAQISVVIDIVEPPIGSVMLSMDSSTARGLFLSISGIAEDQTIDEESIRDAIGELANVFTGKLMWEVCGRNRPFKLSLPLAEFSPIDKPDKMVRFSIGLSVGIIDAFIVGAVALDCV